MNFCLTREKSRAIAGEKIIEDIHRNCRDCGSCRTECSFLQREGTPGRIAAAYLAGDSGLLSAAFSCSLCGLCRESCPQDLPVTEMLLELRRTAERRGQGRYREHLPLRWFEALGESALFADYLLPPGCTTVFFPGCALPSIRPRETYLLFRLLQRQIPRLGWVFDCCNKPSHDLGLDDRFRKKFGRKMEKLRERGVTKAIIACPSCLQIFRRYGGDLETESIYSRLTEFEFGRQSRPHCHYTLHDPCTARFDPDIHRAVRQLLGSIGLPLIEMVHNRATTFCCGEGGAALCPSGGRKWDWREKRLAEAGNSGLLTYCAGCTSALASERTYHLLDLLLASPRHKGEAPKAVRAPRTYLNRLYLKLKMKVLYLIEKDIKRYNKKWPAVSFRALRYRFQRVKKPLSLSDEEARFLTR